MRTGGGDGEAFVVARAQGGDPVPREHRLDLRGVDAQAEDLHEPAAAADDLVEPAGSEPRDVAGV
ncbi:hypothetical protein WKI68_12650 [Streptomyces sp. MS1.HAVA.3]|uniref:Uncharacterized protein n=1 Tax=Streptomyces caledonius TaxID=3134107 RepID=A0ABU8U2I8_9ACTN